GHVEFAPLEIDNPVVPLVAAAAAPRGDMAMHIPAGTFRAALGEGLHRLALPQLRAVDQHELAEARRFGVIWFQCPGECALDPNLPYSLAVISIAWPCSSVTIAFLKSLCWPLTPLNRLVFPLRISVLTAITLTLNKRSTASLISGFVASIATLKTTWLFS